MAGNILIVEDERALAGYLATALRSRGYTCHTAYSLEEAREVVTRVLPDVVLLDLRLPDGEGSSFLSDASLQNLDVSVIIMTAHGSIRSAVDCIRLGAVNYLAKPFEPEEMFLAVERAMKARQQDDEVRALRARVLRGTGVGAQGVSECRSQVARKMLAEAQSAADRGGSVILLSGETGTGKNWLARWIHAHSPRAQSPFFILNCATLTEELAASELFGHEPGSFTGAKGRKRGLMELADGGTLVLDEIAEMGLGLQAKLLTFLDNRTFLRVGGERPISVDTRIIGCTNANLEQRVGAGTFRRDLFYRLNVFPIEVPPLRERVEDLPVLVGALLERLSVDFGFVSRPQLTPDAMRRLASNPWPGNIRELRNALERACILSGGKTIGAELLHLSAGQQEWRLQVGFPDGKSLHEVTAEVARNLILEALRRAPTKQQAARLLGLSRHALSHQMAALGIQGTDEDETRSA